MVLSQTAENIGTCGSVKTNREYRHLRFCYNQLRIQELVVLLQPTENSGTCGSVKTN